MENKYMYGTQKNLSENYVPCRSSAKRLWYAKCEELFKEFSLEFIIFHLSHNFLEILFSEKIYEGE